MKIATWTHSFVCLSKKSQFFLPTPQERYQLKCAGLGEKKITIEVDGKGFDTLYEILLEQLNAGGIDLLRTGFGSKSKTLEVIPVPPGCSTYSVGYLKDVLQQAKCYVRPIQRDLPKEIPTTLPEFFEKSPNKLIYAPAIPFNMVSCNKVKWRK